MLHITIGSTTATQLSFATFEQLGLPGPIGGVDQEINGDLILKFEDEAEALLYAEQLEDLSSGLDDKSSVENQSIGEMIVAIRNDEFVQTYLRELE